MSRPLLRSDALQERRGAASLPQRSRGAQAHHQREGERRSGMKIAPIDRLRSDVLATFQPWVRFSVSTGARRRERVHLVGCAPSARVVTLRVSPSGVSAIISSAEYSVSPACTSLRNLHDALVNATKTSPIYCGKSVAPGAVKAKTCNPCTTGAICPCRRAYSTS